MQNHPWILGDDFNMILSIEEKRGINPRLEQDRHYFEEFINDIKLVDLEPSKGFTTRNNRRSRAQNVSYQQDRLLTFESLLTIGYVIASGILPIVGSNDLPIYLIINVDNIPLNTLFQFRNFWLNHPDFQENIAQW